MRLRRLEDLRQAHVVFDASDPLPDLLLGDRDALFREFVNVAADVAEARLTETGVAKDRQRIGVSLLCYND